MSDVKNLSISVASPGIDERGELLSDSLMEFIEDLDKEYSEDSLLVDLFDKLNMCYVIGWNDFTNMPLHIIMMLNEKIDKKLEAIGSDDPDNTSILSGTYLAVLCGIGRALGGK